jgi:hypothetical protein
MTHVAHPTNQTITHQRDSKRVPQKKTHKQQLTKKSKKRNESGKLIDSTCIYMRSRGVARQFRPTWTGVIARAHRHSWFGRGACA